LLLSHGETGTLGVIVNRVTEVTFAEAFPGFSKKRKNEEAKPHALSFGGPVALNGLLYLFRSEDPPEKAAPVMKDVYFASDAEVLSELLELEMELANENRNKNGNEKESHSDADPDQRLRLFLGHAGWAPGQLDMEIRRGDWTLLPADPFTVFQKDPGRLWPELTTGGRVVAGLWH
jgi:putative transcriptional regulator